MQNTRANLALLACFLTPLLMNTGRAAATTNEFSFSYDIKDDVSDPQTAIAFRIGFDVIEADRDGDWVGWQIDMIYFTQYSLTGGSDLEWKTDVISVATSDGLWWVKHSDPDAPVAAEFQTPPTISGEAGTASANMLNGLIFYIYGLTVTPVTGKANIGYRLTRSGETDPDEEDEDEGVDINNGSGADPACLEPISITHAPAAGAGSSESSDLADLLNAIAIERLPLKEKASSVVTRV